jgi:hypothetical protein
MKVIFIAGSFGSGTTAVAGALDKMGIASLPPHFRTNDPLTPSSFESLAFRDLVNTFASESTLTIDESKSVKFVLDLKNLLIEADKGPADTVVLKMPLASICLPQIIEAADPYVILVHRPFDEIEASRIRRRWQSPVFGAPGAQAIYSKLFSDLVAMNRSFLAISYRDFQKNPRRNMLNITNFCELSEINDRIDDAIKFVRPDSASPALET